VKFLIPRPRFAPLPHEFDGEHHWEINKAGYSLSEVTSALLDDRTVRLAKTFRVHEHAYHRFFVFDK